MRPKARSLLLSPLGERDLEEIWTYTARTWSRDQAERYHAMIFESFEGLASGRRIGRDAGDIREGYRKYSVGRHILFYRETDEQVVVIRILHQSMDVAAHLEIMP